MGEVAERLPDFTDPRDLVFVEEFVRTGDPIVACTRANMIDVEFSPEVRARAQLKRPEIQAAVKLLEGMNIVGMDVGITREAIVAQMEYVYAAATKNKDFKSAIAAKSLQASLLGMLEQKITLTHNVPVREMTTEQIEKLLAKRMKVIDVTPEVIVGEGKTHIERAIGRGTGSGIAEPPQGNHKPA